jgi:macrolide-specific efflux system membrane fusion protein
LFNWTTKRPIGRYVWIAATVVIGLLILKACAFPTRLPPRYITAPVAVGDIEQTVLADGALQPFTMIDVGAQASGQIKSLKVDLGDSVTKGQPIAVIDSSNQTNALLNAQANLEQQQAQRMSQAATVAQDQLLLQRQTITLAGDASSQQDYEAAATNLKLAQASLAAIDAQIKQATVSVQNAKVNLGYTQILAPMDGVVVAVVAKEGQTVNAVQTAPTIVKLARLDTMTVTAQISEADVIRVHAGQSVYFTILGDPDHRYNATLRKVAPAPDSVATTSSATSSSTNSTAAAVYYSGLFDVANPDGRLRTSMTAQVYIVLARARGVLLAPAAALGPKAADGADTVQVLDPRSRKVAVREVRVGINNNVNVQVLGGLSAGELVVVGEGAAKEVLPPPGAFRGGPPPGGGG